MNIPDKAYEAAGEAVARYSHTVDAPQLSQIIAEATDAAAPYLYAQALDALEEHLRAGVENARNGGERHLHEDALIMLDAYRGANG